LPEYPILLKYALRSNDVVIVYRVSLLSMRELVKNLEQQAEDKFGKERAAELASEIEQLVAEIERLRSAQLDLDDEP
jgi:hypothetical protein